MPTKIRRRDRDRDPAPAPTPPAASPPASGGDEPARFVAGVRGRLGGRYCTPPGQGCTDCSGLVCEEFARATGRGITCDSHALYAELPSVNSGKDLRPGDLVFWATGFSQRHGNRASHVGVYVGDGRVVNALNEERGIVDSPLDGEYGGDYLGARRLPWQEAAAAQPATPATPAPVVTSAAPPAVTAETPWRELGNTDRASFRAALSRSITADEPPPLREADALYDALAPHGLTRLAAPMAWIERRNETDPGGLAYYPRSYHNLWAVKRPNGEWARYGSYAEAARAWAELVLGPRFADFHTVAEFITSYAPPSENDTTRYVRQLVAELNALPPLATGDPDAPAPDPWRPYPYPKMVDLVVAKPRDTPNGFDACAPRRGRIRGSADHITAGDASIEWYADFFGIGGERARDALVDTVLGRDGRIGLLNDWRNPERGGRRAGWANGGTNGLEGIGIPFFAKFPAINEVLVSKEHVAREGQALTDAQLEASIELSTAIAQEARCSWQTFPLHQDWQVDIQQYHAAFATKSCPTPLFLGTYRPVIVREIKAKLEAWQGGAALPKPTPPEPSPWPFGMPLEQVANYFGTLRRYLPDGTTRDYPFDPRGTISLTWLARCKEEGRFFEAEEWRTYDTNLSAEGEEHFVTFEGGYVLWCPVSNQRAGWQWLDRPAVQD